MSRYVSPVETITDINGAPMVGAKLVFYEVGTTTKKTIYSDAGLTIPITNPVTAVSSDAGAIYPDIYLDGIYKVVQQDDSGTPDTDDGAILWTRDPVGDITAGNFEIWLNDTTYNIPEVVYASDDNYYISLVDANQGNEPSASPAQWQLIPMKDMARKTDPILNGDVSGTAFLDEDDMVSDSATKFASQQSIKTYVDSKGAKQIVTATDKIYQTTTANIPIDDTIPLITEGDALVDVVITPIYADSTLVFDFSGFFDQNTAGGWVVLTLVDVTGATILTATTHRFSAAGYPTPIAFEHAISSPGTSSNTYRIRFGIGSATGIVAANGTTAAARLFGGVAECRLTVTEIR